MSTLVPLFLILSIRRYPELDLKFRSKNFENFEKNIFSPFLVIDIESSVTNICTLSFKIKPSLLQN